MKNILFVALLLSLIACAKKDKSAESEILTTHPNVLQADLQNPSGNHVVVEYVEEEVENEIVAEQPTHKNYLCDFSNQNESISVEIKIEGQTAVLVGQGSDGKFIFDGFTLSPSGNENAAVTHEDPDQLVVNGKVIKISARIVMNQQINQGELQVSYKIKNDDKGITVTDFAKIADINNCSLK